jgi:hypothetical protein
MTAIHAASVLIARVSLINALLDDKRVHTETLKEAVKDSRLLALSMERAEFDNLAAAVACAEALTGKKVQ